MANCFPFIIVIIALQVPGRFARNSFRKSQPIPNVGCGSCDGPWLFPFSAEKVLHYFIPTDETANRYLDLVIENRSLTSQMRRAATYAFLKDPSNGLTSNLELPMSFTLEELYRNATFAVNYEKAAYESTLCLKDCAGYFDIIKIVNDPLLTDEMICKNLQILFCDLSEREMKALRARRAYGYVIESGRRPPTFEDMFLHTFLINGSATKMEKFKFSLFLDEDVDYSKLKEFEGTFIKWAGSREDPIPNCTDTYQPFPYRLSFNAEQAFIYLYYDKSIFTEDVVELFRNRYLTKQNRSNDLLSLMTKMNAVNVWKDYNDLLMIEHIEVKNYQKDVIALFANAYADDLLSIVNATYNFSLSDNDICWEVKPYFSRITLDWMEKYFPPPPYRYDIRKGLTMPSIHDLLSTYTFRNLNNKAREQAENFADNYRYRPPTFEQYKSWADYLPDAAQAVSLKSKRSDTKAETMCYGCMGSWFVPLDVNSAMNVLLDNSSLHWYYHYAMNTKNVPRAHMSFFTSKLVTAEYKELYDNLSMVVAYEIDQHFNDLHDDMTLPDYDYFRNDSILSVIELIVRNMSLTQEEACNRIGTYLCSIEPYRHRLLILPRYTYKIEQNELPTLNDMWNKTKTIQKIPEIQRSRLHKSLRQDVLLNHNISFYQLRSKFKAWVGTLPTVEAQAMTMLHWQIYLIRLKRLHRDNLQSLKKNRVPEIARQRYNKAVENFFKDAVLFSEIAMEIKSIELNEVVDFPCYLE